MPPRGAIEATGPPHRRPGNDVTLPREAGKGSRVAAPCGFGSGGQARAESLLNGRICLKR